MAREILTTLVGSYPIPDWLPDHANDEAMRDATAMMLQLQEAAGIDLLTDGEFYRFDRNHPETRGVIDYFIRPLRNVRTVISRSEERMFREMPEMEFRNKPAGVVEGQLGEGTLNLLHDFQRARGLCKRALKFTVGSPYQLGMTLVDRHYKSPRAVVTALADVLGSQIAEIDAEVVQIDDEYITGHAEDGPWVAEVLNRLFGYVQKKAAIHLCFGNYNGQVVQKGTWAGLMGFINSLQVDHVVVEMAHRGAEELAAFKDLRPGIGLGLGVVDVKRLTVETGEEIARLMERAEEAVGKDRITYIHPDCGLSMLKRPIADAKMAALAKGRDLFLGSGR